MKTKKSNKNEIRWYRMMMAAHYPPMELIEKSWAQFWYEIKVVNEYEQSPISKSLCKLAFEQQKKAAIKYMEGR